MLCIKKNLKLYLDSGKSALLISHARHVCKKGFLKYFSNGSHSLYCSSLFTLKFGKLRFKGMNYLYAGLPLHSESSWEEKRITDFLILGITGSFIILFTMRNKTFPLIGNYVGSASPMSRFRYGIVIKTFSHSLDLSLYECLGEERLCV